MSVQFMIQCVIEHESFNGTPCGRSVPPWKAEVMEGKKRGGWRGGSHTEGHSLASDELEQSFPPHVG